MSTTIRATGIRGESRNAFTAVRGTLLVVLVLAASVAWPGHLGATHARASGLPNILVLVSDDQTKVTFNRQLMPSVFAQLVDKGVQFNRAYVNTSLCCPSRSQIMTGLYGHHTGVDDNTVPLSRPTIIQALHDAGYRTGLAGKYLNSMNCDVQAGFDDWVCQKMGLGSFYNDPILNVNGVTSQYMGYTTDILANYTAGFIQSTPADQPFFAIYTPISPHLPGNDARCTQPVTAYRPPSFDEDNAAHKKPAYLQQTPFTANEIATVDSDHAAMIRATTCLDGAMGTILAALGDREQNTFVVYLSDNGFLYGEHRWRGKAVPYEESTHLPFVVRYPALVPETAPFKSNALVENVDVAPTLADLAGIPWGADGLSLLPLIKKTATSIRSAALLEYCEGISYPCLVPKPGEEGAYFVPSFTGVVWGRYKYIEYVTGEKELYDVVADPFEMTNHAGDLTGSWPATQSLGAAQVQQLMAAPAVDTTIVSGPKGAVAPGTYSFVYFSQSRLATYQCRLDVGATLGNWFPCNGQSASVTVTDPGTYTLEVQGTDEGGQTDPSPATRSFTV